MEQTSIQEIITLYEQAAEGQFNGNFTSDHLLFFDKIKNDPQAWYYCGEILRNSKSYPAKLTALKHLDHVVRYQWDIVHPSSRQQLRDYVIMTLMTVLQVSPQNSLINMLNLIIVEIVKKECPEQWSSFISDLVESASLSPFVVANNIHLFRLITDDIFDDDIGDENLLTQQRKDLVVYFDNGFPQVFEHLIMPILGNSSALPTPVVEIAAKSLGRFVTWCNLKSVFESALLESLILNALPIPRLQIAVINVINSISELDISAEPPVYRARLTDAFTQLVEHVKTTLPPMGQIPILVSESQSARVFVTSLVTLFTTFLKNHRNILQERNPDALSFSLTLLHQLTSTVADDDFLLKVIIDFWVSFTSSLIQQKKQFERRRNNAVGANDASQNYFRGILQQLRLVCINRMPVPEEIIIKETAYGQQREKIENTAQQALFQAFSKLFQNLMDLNSSDTMNQVYDQVSKQLDGTNYTFKSLSSLSYSIGCLNQRLSLPEEKEFVISIIRDMLTLCERKYTKEHKAVIATNIMYVVSSYPRFLADYYTFLRTVCFKLFEFFHEPYPNVKTMSILTFRKLAQSDMCRSVFVVSHPSESVYSEPLIDVFISNFESYSSDLDREQNIAFISCLALIISAQRNPEKAQHLVMQLISTSSLFDPWAWLIEQTQSSGISSLYEPLTNIDLLHFFVRVHLAFAVDTCGAYVNLFNQYVVNFLEVFSVYSDFIDSTVQKFGPAILGDIEEDDATSFSHVFSVPIAHLNQDQMKFVILSMRKVRKAILKLFKHMISLVTLADSSPDTMKWYSNDLIQMKSLLYTDKFRSIIDNFVVQAYATSREYEILNLTSTMITALKQEANELVEYVFRSPGLFLTTFDMLANCESSMFPKLRLGFFHLLHNVAKHSYSILPQLPFEMLTKFMDAIIGGCQHIDRDIAVEAISTCSCLLDNVKKFPPPLPGQFYQAFFLKIVSTIFEVLTDGIHKTQVEEQVAIVMKLADMIRRGDIVVNLFRREDGFTDNKHFLSHYLILKLSEKFPYLSDQKLQMLIHGIFSRSDASDVHGFISDFMVDVQRYSTEKIAQQS